MLSFFNASFDTAASIATAVTAVVAVSLIIIGLIVRYREPQSSMQFKYAAVGVCAGFSIGILTLLMYLKFDEYAAAGYIDNSSFIPVAVLLCVILILAVATLIISVFRPEKTESFAKIALFVIGIMFLAFLVYKTIQNYKNGSVIQNEALLYVFAAVIVAVIALIAALVCKKQSGYKTKSIVYAAICIAMSFALSYLRLFELPQGGSITFASLLPLMLYSYMFGGRKGVLAGLVYGMLQFIQAPWFLHPVQFLLDYPIAFSAIGLTGFLREREVLEKNQFWQFSVGATVATVIRYLSHVISGIFVFGSGDPENYGAVAWSFLYNSFTFADLAIVLVVAALLFASKTFTRLVNENSIVGKAN